MKAAVSREENLHSSGAERAGRAALLGAESDPSTEMEAVPSAESDPSAEMEACALLTEVSHHLSSHVFLPYGSHQQFLFS